MRADPDKARAWQQRGARRYAENRRERGQAPRTAAGAGKRSRPTRNDGPWRAEVLAWLGERCFVPGCMVRDVQIDHLHPRGQGGRSVRGNGFPMCEPHHTAKTAGTLQIRPEWLTDEHREYLAAAGWVAWDENGRPYGVGYKHFTATMAAEKREGGTHARTHT